ncbi:PEP-CTERM sorting domain-containing protein [Aquabacterium sp.]|uniref:PEP-CTERM sorting domain-containing protein n=1 Tax=Aquabacterium sp. TaxID=1872578 RepID=UPI003D6CB9F6
MNKTIQLALALAMGASTAAHATGTAAITFSNLSIATIDLNPQDNVIAGYEVLSGGSPTTVRAVTSESTEQSAPGIFTPLSATSSDTTNGSTAQASIGASGFLASASGPGASALVASSDDPIGSYTPNIRLAPGTAILVTGDYQIELTTDCTEVSYLCRSSVELRADFPGSEWNISFDDVSPYGEFGSSTSFNKYFANETTGTQTFTGSAGVTYWNFSNHTQDLTLRFIAEAGVRDNSLATSITSVPEPMTTSLMVAGLLTAAALGRRRVKSQG